MDVSYWYPQGITGTGDAFANGFIEDRRALIVSWYHKTEDRPTKGARISLFDLTDVDQPRYRHLLLVTPKENGSNIDFGPAEYEHGDRDALHAGGIVWLHPYLYVADTFVGMRALTSLALCE